MRCRAAAAAATARAWQPVCSCAARALASRLNWAIFIGSACMLGHVLRPGGGQSRGQRAPCEPATCLEAAIGR